jgi:hypothetical protein
LTIFLNDLVLALGLVAVIDCVRGWYDRFKESTGWRRIARGAGAAAVAFGLGSVVVYWGSLQTLLLRKPPPDEIAFAPVLSKPPFRDSTFATSIYGGTLAYFNKNCVRGIVSGSSLLGMSMKCSGSTVLSCLAFFPVQ